MGVEFDCDGSVVVWVGGGVIVWVVMVCWCDEVLGVMVVLLKNVMEWCCWLCVVVFVMLFCCCDVLFDWVWCF